jgi:arginase
VKTHNESIYDKILLLKELNMFWSNASYAVKHNLKANYFPIVLSGDHSSALGTISGIKSVYPTKRLGVV